MPYNSLRNFDYPRVPASAIYVTDSGERRWMVDEAVDLDVPALVISLLEQLRARHRIVLRQAAVGTGHEIKRE